MRKFNHVGFGRGQAVPVLERITNKDGDRVYNTPDGRKYPSVTTVLSQVNAAAIKDWRDRVGHELAKQIANRAAGRGTRLHNMTEAYLKNDHSPFNGQDLITQEFFKSFKPVLNDIDNIHCLETPLYSHYLRLAGTVDCIAEYKGVLSVIDFKTASKAKYKDQIHNYFMQCTAYAIMYEELTGIPIPQIAILIAVEDDTPQVFIEKRDNWAKSLLHYRNLFESKTTAIDKMLVA